MSAEPDNFTKKMRVLFVSTSYPRDTGDWRGVFIHHLASALARSPLLRLSIWAPPGDVPLNADLVMTPGERRWLSELMEAGGISHLMRTHGRRALLAPIKLVLMLRSVYRRRRDVDVYHINWLQCALPLPSNGKPALITVLGNDMKLLRLPFMQSMLRRVARRRKVAICPNAEWMLAPLQAAFQDTASIFPVSFGIDPRWYAIQRHPVSSGAKRWLVVTRLTADKLGPLFQWSRDLFRPGERELHLFGPMQEDISIPEWVHYHGAATPEQLADIWFPFANGLITLSRHAEGRPQVMLEAMAAGLPIIASRMPAHATIVNHEHTGMLCDTRDDYQTALDTLEQPDVNERVGQRAREWALSEIGTWDDCAQRYTRIYRTLLENSPDE